MASRCTRHSGETSKSLVTVIAGVFRTECVALEMNFCTDRTNPTGVCIDNAATNSNAGWKAKIVGSFFTKDAALFAGTTIGSILSALAQ